MNKNDKTRAPTVLATCPSIEGKLIELLQIHEGNKFSFTVEPEVPAIKLNDDIYKFDEKQVNKLFNRPIKEGKKYGIYSDKQSKLTGIFLYLTPEGKTVKVTSVSDTPGVPSSHWDDKVDIGEVTKFVKRISGSEIY